MTRTVIRFTREGLEGRVTGYKEVTVPAHSITAKNSTSLLRNPASRADFVRGKAGFLPFSPGGLDVGSANETAEALEQQEQLLADRIGADGLLQVAPGLRRGLTLPDAKKEDEDLEKEEEFKFGDVKPLREKKAISNEPQRQEKKPLSELDGIDDLLPIEFPLLAPTGELALSAAVRTKQKEWAHMVDVNQELKNFHELVPNMAKEVKTSKIAWVKTNSETVALRT
jgi:antiviral helicase SKI2